MTLLTDVPPSSAHDAQARTNGLEVVVVNETEHDRAAVEADRISLADDVIHVGDEAPARPRRVSTTTLIVGGVVFLAGVIIRWLLFDTPAAVINADEAYTRLETFEILRGQFPVALGGTVYTFPVEAYLYTPFTYLFNGANVVPLKLLSTLSWVGAAVTLFFVGRRLLGERAGLIAASLCWITPGSLMVLSITAYPAYASGMFVVSLAFLTATVVLDRPEPSRRLLVTFGVLAGFAFWLHPMFLTVMVPMTVVVLWAVRRRLDGWIECDRRRHRRVLTTAAVERGQRLAIVGIAGRGAR